MARELKFEQFAWTIDTSTGDILGRVSIRLPDGGGAYAEILAGDLANLRNYLNDTWPWEDDHSLKPNWRELISTKR